jgi:UDP-glucose 4-epimerase
MSGKLLVTGVNGFLASRFIEKYADSIGMDIVAVWHSDNSRCLNSFPGNICFEQCDLTDLRAVQKIFGKYDIAKILHSAGYIPNGFGKSIQKQVNSNIVATANLVECAASSSCARFVYCSSICVYGDAPFSGKGWEENQQVVPSSFYGWTKYAGEECLRLSTTTCDLTGISLRLAGVHGVGRRGGAVFQIMKNALSGNTIEINYPGTPLELLFVDDVLEVFKLAIETKIEHNYECLNAASVRIPSLEFLSEEIKILLNSKSEVVLVSEKTPQAELMNTDKLDKLLNPAYKNLNENLVEIREWLGTLNLVG